MIPLAQFLATDDEIAAAPAPRRAFAPAVRTPAAPAPRPLAATLPRLPAPALGPSLADLAAVPPPLARAAAAPALPRPATAAEARAALVMLETERRRWSEERRELERERDEALAQAKASAEAEVGALRQDLERVSAERLDTLRRTLESDHSGALELERRRWVAEEGDRLADLVVLQMAVFEDTLRATLTALLRPLVLDARKRQAVDELAGAVNTIAFDGHAARISATGPSDLLGALEERLGDKARHVVFSADDRRPDVRIDADDTVIETRLSAWLKAVEEALS